MPVLVCWSELCREGLVPFRVPVSLVLALVLVPDDGTSFLNPATGDTLDSVIYMELCCKDVDIKKVEEFLI